MAITEFRGDYAFLSNFYRSPVRDAGMSVDGDIFPTVEHAFQANKISSLDPKQWRALRAEILAAKTAGEAKKIGRRVPLRPYWEKEKIAVMRDLLEQKFSDKTLAGQLLATGDEELIEGNYWNDCFWGVCNGKGENHLGKLLMEIRAELQEFYKTPA